MAGHLFPAFLRFRGGRGVATGLGVVAALSWPAAAAAVGVWIIVVALTRYISVASIYSAVAAAAVQAAADPAAWDATGRLPVTIFFCAAALVVFVRHRENLERLANGTEPRIGGNGR